MSNRGSIFFRAPPFLRAPPAQTRKWHFWFIDDGGEMRAPRCRLIEMVKVPPFILIEDTFAARVSRPIVNFLRELQEIVLVHIANDRHEQALLCIRRSQRVVGLENQFRSSLHPGLQLNAGSFFSGFSTAFNAKLVTGGAPLFLRFRSILASYR